jgi:hypothetical protein
MFYELFRPSAKHSIVDFDDLSFEGKEEIILNIYKNLNEEEKLIIFKKISSIPMK